MSGFQPKNELIGNIEKQISSRPGSIIECAQSDNSNTPKQKSLTKLHLPQYKKVKLDDQEV